MANSIKRLDAITFISLCVMVFFLPFSKSMLEICFVAALVSWLARRILSIKQSTPLTGLLRPIPTPLNVFLYLFIFLSFLSVLVSPDISLSLRALFSKTLKMMILFFIIVETVDSRKKVSVILITLLSAVAITGIDGIFQLMKGTDFIRRYAIMGDRVTGPFLNPNNMAAWLAVAVPLLSCFLNFSGKKISKMVKLSLLLLNVVLIVCLVLTYTRGAWIAVVLSLALTGILKSKRLALITIVVATLLFFFSTKSVKERTVSVVATGSNIHRAMLWREAVSIIKDFPVLGCGLNTYSIVAPKYKIAEGGGIYPHNSYLQMAAETGLLGLGAFLLIMAKLFETSLAKLKKIDNWFYSAVAIGLLSGLLAFLIHSFVDTNLYSLGLKYLMWIVIGLIVAIQRIALKEKSASEGYSA